MRTRYSGPALFTAALLGCGAAPLGVQGEESKSLLGSIRLGEHIYGPKVTQDDLKGRVVLIEYWGRN